jgi:hypothetical protein
VRNVLDDRAGHNYVEAAKARDLLELGVAVGRDNVDPLGAHQLAVAVERLAIARVAVARDDLVTEPTKCKGERPEPRTYLEHLSALEASTP